MLSLTSPSNSGKIYVDAASIATIEPVNNGSRVTTVGGTSVIVSEKPDAIHTSVEDGKSDTSDLITAVTAIATAITSKTSTSS